MFTYKVTVKPVGDTESGAFAGLTRFDGEAKFELLDEMPSAELMEHLENSDLEVYEVIGSRDLSRFLEDSDGVVEYEEVSQ